MNILLMILTFLFTPVLIICLLAFIEERGKKKIRLTLEKSLDRLIKENKLLLEDIEFFGRKAIGLDKKNKKLVFVDYTDNVVNQSCIDLNNLVFCRMNEIRDETSGDIKEVFIELKKKNYNESLKLTFYNRASDIRYIRTSMIRKANDWKNELNIYTKSGNVPFEYVL